jgi:hypothetical protein
MIVYPFIYYVCFLIDQTTTIAAVSLYVGIRDEENVEFEKAAANGESCDLTCS